MREVMTEKKTPPPPRPNRSRQQWQCFKKPEMPAKVSKEAPDMRQMQWPAGGSDGSEGEKKRSFLCGFPKEDFLHLRPIPDM